MSFSCDYFPTVFVSHDGEITRITFSTSQCSSLKKCMFSKPLGLLDWNSGLNRSPKRGNISISSASRVLSRASLPIWVHCRPLHWSPGPQAAAHISQPSCLLPVPQCFPWQCPSVAPFPICLPSWTHLQAEPISFLIVKSVLEDRALSLFLS